MTLHVLHDRGLLDPPGEIAVYALELDLDEVRVRVALAEGCSPARTQVASIAEANGALAALNAGYFEVDGKPSSLLRVGETWIGTRAFGRAAIGFDEDDGRTARVVMGRVALDAGRPYPGRGRPYPGRGRPCPGRGRRIVPLEDFDSARWEDVEDVVSGIGLLVAGGRPVPDLGPERASPGFDTARHPRSIVGLDRRGHLWLVAVDGRRPGHSLGMTFRELQGLAALLGLTDALNLDGGGSTTLVALGRILNCPTDAAGPRAVSDAIVVLPAR